MQQAIQLKFRLLRVNPIAWLPLQIPTNGEEASADCGIDAGPFLAEYPGLVCYGIEGKTTPLVDDGLNYTTRIDNIYDREITYSWELVEGETVIASGNTARFGLYLHSS